MVKLFILKSVTTNNNKKKIGIKINLFCIDFEIFF